MPTPEPLRRLISVTQLTDSDIRRIMRDAAAEADRIVRSLDGVTGPGARLRSAQIALAKVQVEAWGEVGQAVRVGIGNAVDSAAELNAILDQRLFAQIGQSRELWGRAVLGSSREGINSLISRMENGITLSDRVYRNTALSRGYVDRAVNNGLLLGKSAAEIAKDVKGFISPNTPGGASYAAMRLGRTEIQNAYHQTSREHYKASPWIERVKWSVSGAHPREDLCDDYAQDTSVPTWGPGEYRPNEVPDKPHPQCLCYIEPIVESLDKFAKNFNSGKYDDYINKQMGNIDKVVGAGPVDYQTAKKMYSQVRKDTNYRMSVAQNRAETARRLGISVDDLDEILKSKGKVLVTPKPTPAVTTTVDYKTVKSTYAQVRKDTNYKLSAANNRAETARRLGISADDVDRILKTKGKAVAIPQPAVPKLNIPSKGKYTGSRDEWLDDMYAVNPHRYAMNWETKEWYRNNCTSCSMSYEARRRGYNVVARGGIKNGQAMHRVMQAFDGGTDRLYTTRTWDRAADFLGSIQWERMPVGSRGFVDCAWKNGGAHIWNWEKVGQNKIRFIDSQPQDTWMGFSHRYFHGGIPGSFRFIQVNDLGFATTRGAGRAGTSTLDALLDSIDIIGQPQHDTVIGPFGNIIGRRGHR